MSRALDAIAEGWQSSWTQKPSPDWWSCTRKGDYHVLVPEYVFERYTGSLRLLSKPSSYEYIDR